MKLEQRGADGPGFEAVLTGEALDFVAALESEFGQRRRELLQARVKRRAQLRDGGTLAFLGWPTPT